VSEERSRLLRRLGWFGLVLAAGTAVQLSRASLAPRFLALREISDVYALPAPEQVVVGSLGYRAALADWLFAHVLVWHGIHFEEKRRFEFAADYLETVAALDPTFREPYYYGDTLIAMQPVKPRQEDYRRARKLLESGLKARPYDTELWLSTGQFVAYVAAPWLEDPKEQAQWRLAGARILAQACELVGSNENIPYNCITAAGLLTRAGEREATIQFLERLLAVSDDEELRKMAMRFLQNAHGERSQEVLQSQQDRLRRAWKADLPFVSLTRELLLGPPFAPARCAGGSRPDPECATSWRAWRTKTNEIPAE
jgi:tetratricopeptide (TPR) repeat protein